MPRLPSFAKAFVKDAVADWDIHSPAYRPENVTLVRYRSPYGSDEWGVRDWNGTCYDSTLDHDLARRRLNVRRGVIQAAITRRANKAKEAR